MNHWSLLNLDIIGFTSTLENPVLPRVLAPVFQDREEKDTMLLPPFTLVVDEVFNAGVAKAAELDSLVAQQKVTRLPQPLEGKVNHDLWVNEEGTIAYDPKVAVKKAFASIFSKNLALAEEKLKDADYEAACQHAAIARAVNPAHIAPLVIRAAAERLMRNLSRLAFTRHIASDYLTSSEFDRLVDERTGGESSADARGSAVMKGIAAIKPRLFQAA